MALPLAAAEKIIRTSAGTPGWLGRLLLFSLFILLACLVIWGGLLFGYKPYLTDKVKRLDANIANFNQQVSESDRQELTIFYSQLENMKTILKGHTDLSPMFSWLEKNTVSGVTLQKLSYSGNNVQLALSGISRTLDDATNQMQLFQRQREVRKVSFNSLSANANGTWTFDITILFAKPFTAEIANNK